MMLAIKSLIHVRAIVGLIPFFAPIWSPTAVSILGDGRLGAVEMSATLPFEISQFSNITIELDIFSGRPNPSWRLGANDQEAFVTLLRDTPVATRPRGNAVEPLGYRGFTVRVASGHGMIIIHVFGESIQLDGRVYRDMNRAIEVFIAKTMPRELKERFKDIVPDLSDSNRR
jgi:hypothetical protein